MCLRYGREGGTVHTRRARVEQRLHLEAPYVSASVPVVARMPDLADLLKSTDSWSIRRDTMSQGTVTRFKCAK